MTKETELLKRITVRPDVFGGKPIIRDMRIAVEHVLANMAAGETVEDILENYPFLGAGRYPRVLALLLTDRCLESVCMKISLFERPREVFA